MGFRVAVEFQLEVSMKILIDDKKNYLPDGSMPDIIIRTADVAQIFFGMLTENDELYIDHDLGSDQRTGYDLMCVLEDAHIGARWSPRKELINGLINATKSELPKSITCVSDNPAGRQRIQQVIDKLYGGR